MTASLDEQIVAALCRDGRADLRSVAEATDAVATTVQRRLRAMESDGVVRGYAPQLNYDRLGYRTAVFRLTVGLDAIDDVTERLGERSEFVTVYQLTGRTRVFAVGKFAGEAALAACLRELHADPDVESVETAAVETVVREGSSPLPDAGDAV